LHNRQHLVPEVAYFAASLSSAHLSPCFQSSVAGEKREKPNDVHMYQKKIKIKELDR